MQGFKASDETPSMYTCGVTPGASYSLKLLNVVFFSSFRVVDECLSSPLSFCIFAVCQLTVISHGFWMVSIQLMIFTPNNISQFKKP